jgi:hypothetical protein
MYTTWILNPLSIDGKTAFPTIETIHLFERELYGNVIGRWRPMVALPLKATTAWWNGRIGNGTIFMSKTLSSLITSTD